jgi:hypothetical protein
VESDIEILVDEWRGSPFEVARQDNADFPHQVLPAVFRRFPAQAK